MTYDARQISNWFIAKAERDGRTLSIMSLLKLVYISHGWHLETQQTPLFSNKIEAWQYGPVIPDVYHEFSRQGLSVKKLSANVKEINLEAGDERLLEAVWSRYSKLSARQLSNLTHVEGGPWDIATKSGGNYATIPDALIKQHYELLRSRAAKPSAAA